MSSPLKKIIKYAIIILFGMSVISNNLEAKSKSLADKTYDIGLSGGMWLSGDVNLGDFGIDLTKESSFMFRAFADSYLIPKLAVGIYFNYSPVTVSYGDVSENATMTEFGGAFKPRFFLKNNIAIKPGLNIGYRSISTSASAWDSKGLGINLSVEIQFMMDNFIFYLEPGFLSQPAGGNDLTDITFAPIAYILVGIAF